MEGPPFPGDEEESSEHDVESEQDQADDDWDVHLTKVTVSIISESKSEHWNIFGRNRKASVEVWNEGFKIVAS